MAKVEPVISSSSLSSNNIPSVAKTTPSKSSFEETTKHVESVLVKFKPYQIFLLISICGAHMTSISSIVFMVFGGASDVRCDLNGTDVELLNPVEKNCTYTFYSVIPEFLLYGDKTWITAFLTSIQLTGALFGALLGGIVADRYGRKLNTIVFLFFVILLTPLSALSPLAAFQIPLIAAPFWNWEVFAAFRFFIGFATGGYDSSAIILAMEWVSDKARLPVQTTLDCINSVGFIWLSMIAYFCGHWKTLCIIAGLQGIPFLIALCFSQETIRWMMNNNQHQRVYDTVVHVARWNGHTESLKDELQQLSELKQAASLSTIAEEKDNAVSKAPSPSYLALFNSWERTKLSLMLIYSFLCAGSIGYMVIFNTGNLLGDIYLNFALLGMINCCAAVAEIGIQRLFKLGRRGLHQISLNGVWIALAVLGILYVFGVDQSVPTLLVVSALIASMFSFPLWVICNLYSGELYPTEIRNMGSGIGSMAARIGGITSPQILLLFNIWKPSPFLLCSVLAVSNAILAFFFLPETGGKLNEKKIEMGELVSSSSPVAKKQAENE